MLERAENDLLLRVGERRADPDVHRVALRDRFLHTRREVRMRDRLAAIGRMAGGIAHEIRNPLSAITHATELLQEEPTTDATMQRLLTIIHENAQRLDRMVNDVLRVRRTDISHRETFKVVEFLKALRAHCRRPLLIIWDSSRSHRSILVRDYVASTDGQIQLRFLSGYAAELNPVDFLWS